MLTLHDCAGTYSMVEFEVLEPATVNFPPDVKQLIILNRAPYTWDAFDEKDVKDPDNKKLYMLDTLVYKNLVRGMMEVVRQSPIKMFHTPLWISDRREDTTLLDELILTRREVDEICREEGGDAIISLESYSLDFDSETQYYTDNAGLVLTRYYEVTNKTTWIIYLPGHPRPFDRYAMTDSLFFPEITDGIWNHFLNPADMVREACQQTGMKYGRYLVPVWTHASRTLFRGEEDSLKLASRLTDRGEWDRAYRIWEDLSRTGDSTVISKALNNMAVYHELEDDLDSASLFVTRALAYDSLDAIINYREELDVRLQNRKEVISQVR